MEIRITCYFCFESFYVDICCGEKMNVEIWDCEVCCNPNKVEYLFKRNQLIYLDISSGNE
jgi:hypothetical protein